MRLAWGAWECALPWRCSNCFVYFLTFLSCLILFCGICSGFPSPVVTRISFFCRLFVRQCWSPSFAIAVLHQKEDKASRHFPVFFSSSWQCTFPSPVVSEAFRICRFFVTRGGLHWTSGHLIFSRLPPLLTHSSCPCCRYRKLLLGEMHIQGTFLVIPSAAQERCDKRCMSAAFCVAAIAAGPCVSAFH